MNRQKNPLLTLAAQLVSLVSVNASGHRDVQMEASAAGSKARASCEGQQ